MNAAAQTPDRPVLANVYMVAAMAGYVANDTVVKLAGTHLPLGTIMVVRGLFALVMVVALAMLMGQMAHWRSLISRPVLARAALDTTATFVFLTALFNTSIDVATSVLQTVPLVVVLFGVLFFGESIGWRRIMAIAVGFTGVLFVSLPDKGDFNIYVLYLLAVVILVAVRDTVTRRIARTTPSLIITLANVMAVTTGGAVLALFEGFAPVTRGDIGLLALAAGFLLLATLCVILALRTADMSASATQRYTAIPISVLAAWLVFDDAPTIKIAFGMVLIMAAGVYTLLRVNKIENV